MSEEILFEDSPIARYMAQAAARPRKGAKKTSIKIETIKAPVHIDEELPHTHPALPVSKFILPASAPQFRWKFLLIGPQKELSSAKNSSLWRISTLLMTSFASVSNSSFSSLTEAPSADYELEPTYVVLRLQKTLALTLLIGILCPMLALSWSSTLAALILVLVWPFVSYSGYIIIKELWYFRTLESIQQCAALATSEASTLVVQLKSAIQLIQEVELVFRGYRITSQLSPIARLEQNAKNRRCQVLRSATRRSLLCLKEAFLSLSGLDPTIFEGLFTTNTTHNQEDEDFETSIGALKASFQTLQLTFDRYLGHLLNSEFTWYFHREESNDFRQGSWRIARLPNLSSILKISSSLSVITKCIKTQSTALKDALSYQDSWIEKPSSLTKSPLQQTRSTTRTLLLEHLNALQASLQTSLARTMLCKDHLQQGEVGDEAVLNEILQVFARMEADFPLQPDLVSSVSNSLNRWTRELQGSIISNANGSGPCTPASTQAHGEFSNAIADDIETSIGTNPSISDTGTCIEKVYEAETGNEEEDIIIPSKLTREERIAIARKEREEARQRESEMFAKLNFVMELKDVLHSRSKDNNPATSSESQPAT